MYSFPFFKCPGRLVFLDDDAFFLDVLMLACADEWVADYFQDTDQCLAFLESQKQAWMQDAQQQREIHAFAQAGQSMLGLVLDYWHKAPERYGLTQLVAFDYAMPGLNGLDALLAMKDWPAWRVLLTGQADELLAVKAFNAKVIDQFISKESTTLGQHLKTHLIPLMAMPLSSQQELWRQGFNVEQQNTLARPDVVTALQQLTTQLGWIEHAVLSQPFGVLGLNAQGRVFWLQLELTHMLSDLVDLMDDHEKSRVDVTSVLRGESLVNIELSTALKEIPLAAHPVTHFADGVLAVVHDLGEHYAMPLENTYAAWRQRFPSQRIRSK